MSKWANQSLERTPLGPPVLHGYTVHGVAQFYTFDKKMIPALLIISGVAYLTAVIIAFCKMPDSPSHLRWLHRSIRWCAIGLPLGLVAGFGIMMLGDLLYKGSGEPFDWGPGAGIGWIAMLLALALAPLSGLLEIAYALMHLARRTT